MKRALIPGRVDRHGVAHPLPHCTGNCNGGRAPCRCATGCTELANDVAPDAERVIRAPVRTPEDDAHILRVRRAAIYVALALWLGLAALLKLFGARCFDA